MRSARSFIAADTGLSRVTETDPIERAMAIGGRINCQTETPAARATTSSSLWLRLRKVAIAPKRTQKGSTCSETVGVRKNDRKAMKAADMPGLSPVRRSISTKSIK